MKKSRKTRKTTGTVRRSFALPARLVEEVREVAPDEGPGNLNALVRVALEQYVARRKDEEFGEEMERMAKDPDIQRETALIMEDLRFTEGDGL